MKNLLVELVSDSENIIFVVAGLLLFAALAFMVGDSMSLFNLLNK